MPTRWPSRAMARIWEWAIPGLIALEPAAMAMHSVAPEADISPAGSDRLWPDSAGADRERKSGQTLRNQLRVEGFGK
jgi:hypothetical protein